MSESFDRDLATLDEMEDLLAAYAEVRLGPSGPVLARIRRQVLMDAALRNAVTATQQRDAATDLVRARHGLQLRRAIAAVGLAAAMGLGTSAIVLAAPPGSPFYNARVAIEAALLPPQVDARVASREQHLDERLAEAEAAAARGDYPALEAALAAYQAEVDATAADVGDDSDRLAHFEAVLAKHVAKLQALSVRLPNQTASDNAAEHAIAASEKAAKQIDDKGSRGGGHQSDPPSGPDREQAP
jgi:hypothetical protein